METHRSVITLERYWVRTTCNAVLLYTDPHIGISFCAYLGYCNLVILLQYMVSTAIVKCTECNGAWEEEASSSGDPGYHGYPGYYKFGNHITVALVTMVPWLLQVR